MTEAQFKDAVWEWVVTTLNPTFDPTNENDVPAIPVIIGNGVGPRPDSLYVSVTTIATTRNGSPSKGTTDGTGTQTIYADIIKTVAIQSFGPGAEDALNNLIALSETEENHEKRIALGISLIDIDDTKDLTELVDQSREERWSADAVIGYVQTITDDSAGFISTVDYSGDFSNPS